MFRKSVYTCSIVLLLSGIEGLGAEADSAKTAGAYPDADRDGWDDEWVAKYPEARRDSFSDADGDGVPNFIEMMLDQDPFKKEGGLRKKPHPLAALIIQRKRQEQRARNRQALAPYRIDCLRDAAGNPTTRAAMKARKQEKARQLTARLAAEKPARERRVKAFLEGPGKNLPEALKAQLRDVVDGEPRFVAPLSHDQARVNQVIDLWPGGSANTDLTGAGTTVAMWDFGRVLETHQQFNTGSNRIINVDNTGGSGNEHATAVATVIAGAGDPGDLIPATPFAEPATQQNQARGMAYEGSIRVYNLVNDLAELDLLASESNAGLTDIVYSNHSYGTACGYRKDQSASSADLWSWFGNPFISGEVDFKLGFYLREVCPEIDEIVHNHEIFLPIWAAGNEPWNFDPDDAPEPKESGEEFEIAHVVTQNGQTYTEFDAPRRKADYKIESFDAGATGEGLFFGNLIPEACSKNVLTVGAIGGSKGPTDDLRIKPDLIAASGGFGSSNDYGALAGTTQSYRRFAGTSFSAASVTGALALVRQRWQQLNGIGQPVLASTWKGLAIATSGPAQGFNSPHPKDGYGMFNALRAIQTIEADHASGVAGTGARICEILLNEGDEASFTLRAAPSPATFRVLICWTDPPGSELSSSLDPLTPVLVNDIDLRVVDLAGGEREPWRFDLLQGTRQVVVERGDNSRDNVEVIDFIGAQAGFYSVTVRPDGALQGGEPQAVSVIVAGDAEIYMIPPFRIVSFVPTGVANPGIFSVTWTSEPGGAYIIEWTTDLGSSWQAIPGEFHAIGELSSAEVDLSGAGDRQFVRVRRIY